MNLQITELPGSWHMLKYTADSQRWPYAAFSKLCQLETSIKSALLPQESMGVINWMQLGQYLTEMCSFGPNFGRFWYYQQHKLKCLIFRSTNFQVWLLSLTVMPTQVPDLFQLSVYCCRSTSQHQTGLQPYFIKLTSELMLLPVFAVLCSYFQTDLSQGYFLNANS